MSGVDQAAIARYFIQSGIAKHRTRVDVLLLKAFIAGVFLSFGGLLSEVIAGGSPGITAANPGLVHILQGFVFPVGLVMIVLQGQELLTSNMMVAPMCVWKGVIPWWGLPYNWFVVFFGNLAGSLFFGAILVKYSDVAAPYAAYIRSAAVTKAVTPQWHQIFLRGIGCNWLVSIAVWRPTYPFQQAAAAKDIFSKVSRANIVAIWIPIWIFVACSFDHGCSRLPTANMYSIPVAIMLHAPITTGEYIKKSLFAAFFGNIVGALFVALPFTYFYLADYRAGGLEDAEEGMQKANGKTSADGSLVEKQQIRDDAIGEAQCADYVNTKLAFSVSGSTSTLPILWVAVLRNGSLLPNNSRRN
ncbi:Formate/nitrite transporter-domain-containing protein [Gautieria morchelliformis]|nr:Formate/nitrite transporter-domain-containing protein [Gautieria morchelliformis]